MQHGRGTEIVARKVRGKLLFVYYLRVSGFWGAIRYFLQRPCRSYAQGNVDSGSAIAIIKSWPGRRLDPQF